MVAPPTRRPRNGPPVTSLSMSVEWAGLGPELLVRLDRDGGEPLTAQLERALRDAIQTGRLGPGERVPSSRALARELGVSRGLVQECYAQLHAEGFLSTRTGSGTRVAAGGQPAPAPAPAPKVPARGPAIDFRAGQPDLASFPRQDWVWAMREVSRTAPAQALSYGDPRGDRTLREVLAGYLRRVRGAVTDPERIIVCAGFAQGANLVLRTLARHGARTVALEDPGDVDPSLSERWWGLGGVPVMGDERGVNVDALARSGADAVVLTPAHQSPTGVVLAPERRQAIAAWARERGGTILEDDYAAEVRYDREPIGALQGLA